MKTETKSYAVYLKCKCGVYMHTHFSAPECCWNCGRLNTEFTRVTARIVHEKKSFWSGWTLRYEESPFQQEKA